MKTRIENSSGEGFRAGAGVQSWPEILTNKSPGANSQRRNVIVTSNVEILHLSNTRHDQPLYTYTVILIFCLRTWRVCVDDFDLKHKPQLATGNIASQLTDSR